MFVLQCSITNAKFSCSEPKCNFQPPEITPCVTGFFANLGFAGQNNGYPKNDSLFIMALQNYLYTNDVAGWNNLRTYVANNFLSTENKYGLARLSYAKISKHSATKMIFDNEL